MPDTSRDDGTLSAAMAEDGASALPVQSNRDKKIDSKSIHRDGGLDDVSAEIEGEVDHPQESQNATTR